MLWNTRGGWKCNKTVRNLSSCLKKKILPNYSKKWVLNSQALHFAHKQDESVNLREGSAAAGSPALSDKARRRMDTPGAAGLQGS